MKVPSTRTEKNLRGFAFFLIQMTLAVLLFLLFCVLSAGVKPVVDDDPVCGYDVSIQCGKGL